MPATVNFPPLVSEDVLFQNRTAANQFFNQAVVNDATSSTPGVVKKADVVNYVHFGAYPDPAYFDLNFNGVVTTVVQAASFEDLQDKVTALSNAVATLVQKLKQAGHVQG
jgi:hypothetical protein